jgi:hypothetical protein
LGRRSRGISGKGSKRNKRRAWNWVERESNTHTAIGREFSSKRGLKTLEDFDEMEEELRGKEEFTS